MEDKVISNRKSVEFIRVDNRRSERNGKFKPMPLGQIVKFNKAVTLQKDFKKKFGNQGLMLVEDFEKGMWAEYGIKEPKIIEQKEVQSLKETNAALQAKIAELESQMSSKRTKKLEDGTN